jgi:3-oxoacyl-[acyl-carrier protein] reductase
MKGLGNKVALVTGSSRGIGAAIAKLFAQNGVKVAVHGRDLAALSAVRLRSSIPAGRRCRLWGMSPSSPTLRPCAVR